MDRVVHIRRRVDRAWPTIKGWTTETLKQREDAERDQFGTGRLEGPIDKQKYLLDAEARRVEALARGAGAAPSRHRAKRIRDKFVSSSVLLGHAISTWVDDFRMIPVELLEDECVRVGSQIGKKLLGLEEDVVEEADIVSRLTQAREDEEEYSQEWIQEMEKMMAAYDKKKTIIRSFDRPSFMLDGLECPDPFATQPTTETEGVVGDHPVVDDQGGDIPMSEPIGNDMTGIITEDAGGARHDKPSMMHTSGRAAEVRTNKLKT